MLGKALTLAVAAIAGGAYYVYTSMSYGPLQERVGQVTWAEYQPAHEVERYERDENGQERRVTERVHDSYRVIVAWEGGTYESRSAALYSQAKVGSEVTMQVRRRLWQGKPYGWSVQDVAARPGQREETP